MTVGDWLIEASELALDAVSVTLRGRQTIGARGAPAETLRTPSVLDGARP
jgi:hypothetical protein